MPKKLVAALIILLTVSSISFAGSKPNMREGLWKITSKAEMPGMPMEMPPVTFSQCLTEKDFVPQNCQPGQMCKITDVKVNGNTVSWAIQCETGGNKMKGSGKTTYKIDIFEGSMTISIPQVNMTMKSHMNGRRIGDCK